MNTDSDPISSPAALPARADFVTTHWSMVLEAGHRSSPQGHQALAALCGAYWYPLYAFARRRGSSAADAKDLTQEFFAHLLEKNCLRTADPDRGRFRSFLLTAFKNFAAHEYDRRNARKRGGGRQHFSVDFESGEQRYQFEPVDNWTAERIYERRWALALLDQVMTELQQGYEAAGKSELFAQCKGYLTESGPSYEQAAAALGTSSSALRVAVHRLRQKYRELLVATVAATLDGPEQVADELEHLRRALRGQSL